MYSARTGRRHLERIVFLIGGMTVLGGTFMGLFVHTYWFAFPLLAGVNMVVFALTGFCPMSLILFNLGAPPFGDGSLLHQTVSTLCIRTLS
jgi:hypothetical protein